MYSVAGISEVCLNDKQKLTDHTCHLENKLPLYSTLVALDKSQIMKDSDKVYVIRITIYKILQQIPWLALDCNRWSHSF